jgi:hypothetical protein
LDSAHGSILSLGKSSHQVILAGMVVKAKGEGAYFSVDECARTSCCGDSQQISSPEEIEGVKSMEILSKTIDTFSAMGY